jgi:hypothetical protein
MMEFSRCANEMTMAAAREGQEAAARDGQEAAARDGQEAAARDGQEAAVRDGQEAAARDGQEAVIRSGKEATAGQEVAIPTASSPVDQILCYGLTQIATNCSQVLAACFGPADTEQMVQNQVADLLQS